MDTEKKKLIEIKHDNIMVHLRIKKLTKAEKEIFATPMTSIVKTIVENPNIKKKDHTYIIVIEKKDKYYIYLVSKEEAKYSNKKVSFILPNFKKDTNLTI